MPNVSASVRQRLLNLVGGVWAVFQRFLQPAVDLESEQGHNMQWLPGEHWQPVERDWSLILTDLVIPTLSRPTDTSSISAIVRSHARWADSGS